ncbi:unnamed protein product, partial [marine sediment metagenome]
KKEGEKMTQVNITKLKEIYQEAVKIANIEPPKKLLLRISI